ncbi:GATOR complex protein NPRL2 [Contarinia nasturtii]|uniref:GATOR complex protein NPRL2 n=1 Tax=Contarinia nasturtii TaxID=265458 RepID=UPI0012D4AF54|nr:GATOR complex protein NPRL2 [Contarinia nasturtii]
MASANQFYEGCGQEGPIRCIFLSEFHDTAGSKITCQFPEGYVSKEVFDAVNVYIIPKPQLQGCVLTVNALGYKIVGYPVRIEHQRYTRNAFYFNLCFVCNSWARTVQYEPIVRKLSEYFKMMEAESTFLSRDEGKANVFKVLNKVLTDLNANKATTIVEGETTIHLKIISYFSDPPIIYDHLVPMFNDKFKDIPRDTWDLTTQQVLPYINGINHITRIAADSDVEIGLVKACIQNLVYYQVVEVLPLLKYSNVYMCTRNLQKLSTDKELTQACRKFVALDSSPTLLPSILKIMQIYSYMTHGITLKALCARTAPRENNIDERKLVSFGILHHLIRCINKYPVCISESPINRQRFYTGIHHIDEICCKTGLFPAKIQDDLDKDPCVVTICK